jgi:hypothetical protein
MGGGKVGNLLKVGTNYLPDLGELFALSNLAAIAHAIKHLYEPGARIVVIPDAALHTADMGIPLEETLAHASALKRDLGLMGLTDVIVPDVVPVMNGGWVEGVQRLLVEAKRRAAEDATFASNVRSQIDSLVYSVNTRTLGWSFEEATLAYAAVAGHTQGVGGTARMLAAELYRRSEAVAHHYVAVNWAIRQLGMVEQLVESIFGSRDHLRMSVHAKPGEPRPALFPPTEHFPSLMGLLPMHAVGVRLQIGNKVRLGLAFELAARLRNWTPVEEAGTGRFLWYEAHIEEI